jgi:hypothetical protein
MSVEISKSEQNAAKDFITSFVEKYGSVVYDDVENLPKRPFALYCSKEEVKGECLFIALEYLQDR